MPATELHNQTCSPSFCAPHATDVLYLFGKVKAQDGRYQSCCVLVPNIHRSLLFVPDPSVFDDATGEIAALQQQEAADPSPENKVELMKLLHVSGVDS